MPPCAPPGSTAHDQHFVGYPAVVLSLTLEEVNAKRKGSAKGEMSLQNEIMEMSKVLYALQKKKRDTPSYTYMPLITQLTTEV